MKQLLHRPIATFAIVMCASNILSGCAATTPNTASDTKSVKQIADEAMKSKGKLSKEQINALIVTNAKCTPHDK